MIASYASHTIKISLFVLLFCGAFFIAGDALAADPKPTIKDAAYAVKYVGQSILDPIALAPGETKTVTIRFKNTGTATLRAKGTNYVSAYTMEPRYHASLFQGPTWAASDETAPLLADCAPGATCQLPVQLKAPAKPGLYKEEFYLAAKWHTWIRGGYFYLDILVEAPAPEATPTPSVPQEDAPTAPQPISYRAKLIGNNKKTIRAAGGEKIDITLVYKNDGDEPWGGYALYANEPTALAAGTRLTFADSKWQSNTDITTVDRVVAPGAFERVTFSLRTPAEKGDYMLTVQAAVDGKRVEGSEVTIPVSVTSDAPSHYKPPFFKKVSTPRPEDTAPKPRLAAEPRIKVGLWKVDQNYVLIRPEDDDYNVFAGDQLFGVLKQGKSATLKIRGDVYSLKAGELNVKSEHFIRLEPKNNPHATFSILNYDRRYQNKRYDRYRGAAEYRRTQDGKDLYVINDLLMSDYVAGIGENSNAAPAEYLKAQTVAQRTYAYYIKEYSDKHDERNFDVVATTGDQLYLGYLSEAQRPNFVTAAKATRGYMVTYDLDENPETESNIVITPYFAYTNGRTRSWQEVWGGHKPWLVSVKAVYDAAARRRLFGHGVGMSQLDAAERAEKLGEDWQALLQYYYTGVQVEKIYE